MTMTRNPYQVVPGHRAKLVRCATTIALIVNCALPSGLTTALSAADPSVSVPVQVLSVSDPAPPSIVEPGVVPRTEPVSATPGARMPQYQLHHLDRGHNAVDPQDSRLRLILALPKRPLIVEARVTIDGRPFGHARDQRVQKLLKFAADPEAFRAEQNRPRNIAQATKALLQSAGGLVADIADVLNPNNVRKDTALTENPGDASPNNDDTPDAQAETVDKPDSSADSQTAPENPNNSQPSADANEQEQQEEVAAVPQYTTPRNIYERVERYIAATGQMPSADEVHWLLTHWVDGPVLLFLNEGFQRFRADQMPVFRVLDRDGDGTISADEISMAVTSFNECDLNRDDIVEATELAQMVSDPREEDQHAGSGLLISRIPSKTSAALVYSRLAAQYANSESAAAVLPRFDADGNGQLDADEIRQLHDAEADIRLSVRFDTQAAQQSVITLDGFADSVKPDTDQPVLHPHSLSVSIAGTTVEFEAVQADGGDQISVGAVADGYPLLPAVDPNNDGRFTIREMRQLQKLLTAFDVNADGQIASNEAPSPIRVCFGLGPTAHRSLAVPRSRRNVKSQQITGPEWFQQMDRNGDNDIIRKEFPGTDEQFAEYDADGDGLISASEAAGIEN